MGENSKIELDRFFSKTKVVENGCRVWTAALDGAGYGRFFKNGKARKAHRVAWEIANGPIPDGMLACHRCDNRPCVEEKHLFLGTKSDNNRDMAEKGRSLAGEANRKAKLTDRDIREIRTSKAGTRELARRFGISKQQMGAIRNGSAWKHVGVSA